MDTDTSTFGTLYIPRVYGKNLSAFEIASSGKIAITINDVHSFDLMKTSSNTSSIVVSSNESFSIALGQNNVSMLLDNHCNNFEVIANNKIILAASNGISFSANGEGSFTAQSALIFSTLADMTFDSCNNLYMTEFCNIIMQAADGGVIFQLDPPNANILFQASNNIDFVSVIGTIGFYGQSKAAFIEIQSNANLNIFTNSNLYIYANNMNVGIVAESNCLDIYATSNITINTSNLTVQGSLTVAGSGGMSIIADRGSNFMIGYTFVINENNDLELYRFVDSNHKETTSLVTRYPYKPLAI